MIVTQVFFFRTKLLILVYYEITTLKRLVAYETSEFILSLRSTVKTR